VKDSVKTLTNLLKVERIRAGRGMTGLPLASLCLHGVHPVLQDSVHRLLGKISRVWGFWERNFVEADRSGWLQNCWAQTAVKVAARPVSDAAFCSSTKAYSLAPKEAPTTTVRKAMRALKRMEDIPYSGFIVAGYEDEMQRFLASNPGLRERFRRCFTFPDFTPTELFAVF